LSRAWCSSSCRQKTETSKHHAAKNKHENDENDEIEEKRQQRLTWKTRHAGPPWIRNASFNARLSAVP
jgi:hypothetical protein